MNTTEALKASPARVLVHARMLIAAHGHDNGTSQPGMVPLRLREALKMALGEQPSRPLMMLSPIKRRLIEQITQRLDLFHAAASTSPATRLTVWLEGATTAQVINLIDDALVGWQ